MERAVEAVLDAKLRTADIYAKDKGDETLLGCEAMGAAVVDALSKLA